MARALVEVAEVASEERWRSHSASSASSFASSAFSCCSSSSRLRRCASSARRACWFLRLPLKREGGRDVGRVPLPPPHAGDEGRPRASAGAPRTSALPLLPALHKRVRECNSENELLHMHTYELPKLLLRPGDSLVESLPGVRTVHHTTNRKNKQGGRERERPSEQRRPQKRSEVSCLGRRFRGEGPRFLSAAIRSVHPAGGGSPPVRTPLPDRTSVRVQTETSTCRRDTNRG